VLLDHAGSYLDSVRSIERPTEAEASTGAFAAINFREPRRIERDVQLLDRQFRHVLDLEAVPVPSAPVISLWPTDGSPHPWDRPPTDFETDGAYPFWLDAAPTERFFNLLDREGRRLGPYRGLERRYSAPLEIGLIKLAVNSASDDPALGATAYLDRLVDKTTERLRSLSPNELEEFFAGQGAETGRLVSADGFFRVWPLASDLWSNANKGGKVEAHLDETQELEERTERPSPAVELKLSEIAEWLHSIADRVSASKLDELSEQARRMVGTEIPTTLSEQRSVTLGEIAVAMSEAAVLREYLPEAAQRARALGISWADIARAAGISPSTAQRRWDPEAKARHSEYQRSRQRGTDA
jgi:hypothetical protein